MSDVSGAQVLEAIGEATKDLRAKLATAQARIAELEAALRGYVACPLCPHWMHLHEDGRCGSGCCPCNEPSAALTAEEFEDAEGKP